jgi:hypothetical protein
MTAITSHDDPLPGFQSSCGGEVAGYMTWSIDEPKTSIVKEIPCMLECAEWFPAFVLAGWKFVDVTVPWMSWIH